LSAMASRCTCPKETASWNASANSAMYEPNLDRARTQVMALRLRVHYDAAPGTLVTILHCDNQVGAEFHATVAQWHHRYQKSEQPCGDD
jgi:hypothetical protein